MNPQLAARGHCADACWVMAYGHKTQFFMENGGQQKCLDKTLPIRHSYWDTITKRVANQGYRGTFPPWGKTGPAGHQPSISISLGKWKMYCVCSWTVSIRMHHTSQFDGSHTTLLTISLYVTSQFRASTNKMVFWSVVQTHTKCVPDEPAMTHQFGQKIQYLENLIFHMFQPCKVKSRESCERSERKNLSRGSGKF